jgi:sugar transferase (PEP-CTERM/EpsH1 system associated)
MKILVISPCSPYPVLSGAELRLYYLFRAMSALHEIHLVCLTKRDVEPAARNHLEQLFSKVEMFRVDAPTPDAQPPILRRLGKVWQSPAEYFNFDGYFDDVQTAIRRAIDDGHCDAVYEFGWGMRRYLEAVSGVPIIVDLVDNPVIFMKRRIGEHHSMAGKARAVREWLLIRKLVKDEFRQFRDIVMVSSTDAVSLRKMLPEPTITVVPNGVDSEFFKPGPQPADNDPVLIFTGVMNYGPNSNAMTYFCNAVYPLVREEIPNVSLLIVGRYPPDEIQALGSSGMNIHVTGAVDDIRPYFDRAAVYVCPLQSGSGIKNKILEAWAMQKPVVATSMSCEGINVAAGEDIFVADDRREFANHVIALLRDRELRARLGRNGRLKVEREYSWDSRARMIERIYLHRLEELRITKAAAIAPGKDLSS